MTKETVNEAALRMLESLRQANQAVAESVVAAQERNVKFAQSMFTNGAEVLKNHAEGTQAMLQTLEQQTQKQQELFQKLVQELGQEARTELEQQMKQQQENFHTLVHQFEQQTQKQQEAFQKWIQSSMNLFQPPKS